MLIEWQEIKQLCPDIRKIIHVGAYNGAEKKHYGSIPVKWIEADPNFFMTLSIPDHHRKYHFAAVDYKGTIRFNRCPFGPANSILNPNLNAKRRADVRVEETIIVPADKISSIQDDENTLIMDIQGAELLALKGTDLTKIDYIVTEVHRAATYHDCPMIDELDAYLDEHGFERKLTRWTRHDWGDAIYTR